MFPFMSWQPFSRLGMPVVRKKGIDNNRPPHGYMGETDGYKNNQDDFDLFASYVTQCFRSEQFPASASSERSQAIDSYFLLEGQGIG